MKHKANTTRSIAKGLATHTIPLIAMLLMIGHADAGGTTGVYTDATTTSTEFDAAGKKVDGWIRGTYGKTIALASSAVGIGAAGFSKSYIPAVWGLGIAAAAVVVPSVIGGFFAAVI